MHNDVEDEHEAPCRREEECQEVAKEKRNAEQKKMNAKKLQKKKMNGRRVALFYLKLTKDNFVHSLKVMSAPAMLLGAPSNTPLDP